MINFIDSELELAGCPQSLRYQIDCASDEIFMNIVKYAYKPERGNATISISAGEEVTVRFEDNGKFYNPLEQAAPDLDKPLEERDLGGLGIFLVKNLMDRVYYSRFDNKNILTMTKMIK